MLNHYENITGLRIVHFVSHSSFTLTRYDPEISDIVSYCLNKQGITIIIFGAIFDNRLSMILTTGIVSSTKLLMETEMVTITLMMRTTIRNMKRSQHPSGRLRGKI